MLGKLGDVRLDQRHIQRLGQGGVFVALLVMDKVEADGLLVVSQRIDLLDHTVGASSMAWMMPSLSSM